MVCNYMTLSNVDVLTIWIPKYIDFLQQNLHKEYVKFA